MEETDANVAIMILYHICINFSPIDILKKAADPPVEGFYCEAAAGSTC